MCKSLTILILLSICSLLGLHAQTRIESDLSGKGWKLWYDKDASWKNDELYLPKTDIKSITAAPPTGGWNSLNAAIDVSVPGTVEEYLQVKPGPEGDLKGVS